MKRIILILFIYLFRYKIRGIKNIIFYSLPQYPQFYPELLNSIQEEDSDCIILFSKFDKFELERIVGTKRSERMILNEKSTFLFC